MQSPKWQALIYTGSLALIAIIIFLRLSLMPKVGMDSPFLLFLGIVMVSAFLGGIGPGILTTIVSALAVDYLLVPPLSEVLTGPSAWQTVVFTGEGMLISALAEAMRRESYRARRAVHMRDDIMAILAHDLRNPLSVISGGVSLLKMELPPEPATGGNSLGEMLDVVASSASTMSALIAHLLDASKIEANGLLLECAEVDVQALVEETREGLAPLASRREIEVVTASTGDASFIAHLDGVRVKQLLANLGGNALKFTPKGGRVAFRLSGTSEHIAVAVSDTGSGIDPAALPHLFERFWQGNYAARRGVGLGLYIVKSIVDAHGGSIQVESRVGLGTCFTVKLPRQPRKASATFPFRARNARGAPRLVGHA